MNFRENSPLSPAEIRETLQESFYRLFQITVTKGSPSDPPKALIAFNTQLVMDMISRGHTSELRDIFAEATDFLEQLISDANSRVTHPFACSPVQVHRSSTGISRVERSI